MPSHLKRRDFVINAHLQHAWTRALAEGLDPHIGIDREQRVFDLVAVADPTTIGRYLPWLSGWRRRQWPVRGLRYVCGSEELDAVAHGLKHFHGVLPFLDAGARDIGRYPDVESLLSASAQMSPSHTATVRQAQKERALLESEQLYKGSGWSLVRLNSKAAAIWWGLGTRWCTSSRDGRWFEHYKAKGDLLVLLSPRGRFQIHPATNQVRDASDKEVDLMAVIRSSPLALRTLLALLMQS